MKRHYEDLDVIVRDLNFFSTLPKVVRFGLYKAAVFVRKKGGDILFKQGDYGDLMYVILKGSACVW